MRSAPRSRTRCGRIATSATRDLRQSRWRTRSDPLRPADRRRRLSSGAATTAHDPLPIQPFATANLGDWNAFTNVTTSSLGVTHATVVATITDVTPAPASQQLRGRDDRTGEVHADAADPFPRAGLTLDDVEQSNISDWKLFDVRLDTAPYEVAGHAFACTHLAYSSTDPLLPHKRTRTELWLSPEVTAGGIVAKRETQDVGELHFLIEHRIIGYGTATTTTWGARPAL